MCTSEGWTVTGHQWQEAEVDDFKIDKEVNVMRTVKRGMALMLVLSLLVSTMALPAFAAETETNVPTNEEAHIVSNDGVAIVDPVDALNGMQRSTSKPRNYWDLGSKNYSATLTQVGTSYLYTNYYFHSNSDGELYVDVDAEAQGAGELIVGIYNITDKYDATSISFDIDATGISKTVTFYNLDTNDYYAVYFCSKYNGYYVVYITGSAVVYN